MLQATGHPSEIPGILPAISAGYRGTVLVVKGVWLVVFLSNANIFLLNFATFRQP